MVFEGIWVNPEWIKLAKGKLKDTNLRVKDVKEAIKAGADIIGTSWGTEIRKELFKTRP